MSFVEQEHYYLGVDSGASKTIAVVLDARGRECGTGYAGSGSHTAIGVEQALANIRLAVTRAVTQAGCQLPVQKAWLGVAGIDCEADYRMLYPYLNDLALSVYLTNDAELVLSAVNNVGIVLIAGTGSIALGRDCHGKLVRTGGWGYLIGNEGSGFEIARQAIQAAVRCFDKRGQPTKLLALLLQQWQLRSIEDVLGIIYRDRDQEKIAQFSTSVFTAAREGDAVACMIIDHAAEELALQVSALYQQFLAPPQRLALAFGGGVLLHEKDFQDAVIHRVRQTLHVESVTCVDRPERSAAQALLRGTLPISPRD